MSWIKKEVWINRHVCLNITEHFVRVNENPKGRDCNLRKRDTASKLHQRFPGKIKLFKKLPLIFLFYGCKFGWFQTVKKLTIKISKQILVLCSRLTMGIYDSLIQLLCLQSEENGNEYTFL